MGKWKQERKVFSRELRNDHDSEATTGGVLCKKVILENFTKKETLVQMFSCEFCEISKNTFFTNTSVRLLLMILSHKLEHKHNILLYFFLSHILAAPTFFISSYIMYTFCTYLIAQFILSALTLHGTNVSFRFPKKRERKMCSLQYKIFLFLIS